MRARSAIGDALKASSLIGAMLVVGCTAPVEADPFAGRYRSISGADHDVMVVAPSPPARWLLRLERAGAAPLVHPAGPLVEAGASQLGQWFGANAPRARCLVASGDAPLPVLCATPPGSALRVRGVEIPAATTGWLLVVPKQGGVEGTELVKG